MSSYTSHQCMLFPLYVLFKNSTVLAHWLQVLTLMGSFYFDNYINHRGICQYWVFCCLKTSLLLVVYWYLFVCIQGLLFGPLYHVWYIYLDRALAGRTVRIVLTKLAADQLFMTPLSIVLFFVSLGILEGQKFHDMQHDIRHRGPPLLAVEWTFGPATQLFNFFVLPTRFRVLYDSVVCLCFDVYYSYVKYRKEIRGDKAISDIADKHYT